MTRIRTTLAEMLAYLHLQRHFPNHFLHGNTVLPRVIFFGVSYRNKCYSVLPCSDRDMILVLHSLTPEKVGLPGSELPHSRSVMTSRCNQWFHSDSTFCTLEQNVNFSLNSNLQLKYETKKSNIK